MLSPKLTVLVLVALQLLGASSDASEGGRKVIFVWESIYTCSKLQVANVTCTNIDGALQILEQQKNISTPTDVFIHVGHHQISKSAVISNVRGIRLIGVGERNEAAKLVVINCNTNVGLIFVKVEVLKFENIAIYNCGAGVSDIIWSAKFKIRDEVDLFFKFPDSSFKVGLFVVLCRNVTLNHTAIANTSGVGLLGINVMESVRLVSSTFSDSNSTDECRRLCRSRPEYYKDIAGGAYFLYFDYKNEQCQPHTHLSIHQTSFVNNMDCGFTGFIELFIDFSPTLQNLSYVAGAGGGLSVMLAQRSFSVNVSIQDSVFQNNRGRFGGGAHIGLFSGIKNCHIDISNCTFDSNGVEMRDGEEKDYQLRYAKAGAGLMVFTDLRKPQDYSSTNYTKLFSNIHTSLTINNSYFTHNSAHSGGGIFIYSHHCTSKITPKDYLLNVLISNCNFSNNVATVGAAIFVYQNKFIGLEGGMQFEMSNNVVRNNTVIFHNSKHIDSVKYSSAAVDLRYMQAKLSDNNAFLCNNGTALRISRGYVRMTGNVLFGHNAGVQGGAIQLFSYGVIIANPKSNISFYDNTATVKGGAIYTEHRSDIVHSVDDDCFLYFKDIDALTCLPNQTCPNIVDLKLHIRFAGNKAPLGSIIFGSTLVTCPWAAYLEQSNTSQSPLQFLQTLNQSGVIDFGPDFPSGSSQVSTSPVSLKIMEKPYKFMPGEKFQLMIEAEDAFHQPVPAAITSAIVDKHFSKRNSAREQYVTLGKSGYWYLNANDSVTSTPVVVHGKENEKVSIVIYVVDSFADVSLTVDLQPCSKYGNGIFVYDSETSSCICSELLKEEKIKCENTENGFKLSTPDHMWIGKSNTDQIVVGYCISDYCKPATEVDISDYDSQCAEGHNRKGLLCSTCEEGYSVVFGSNRCIHCSNAFLSLIVAFGAAGIFLILLVAILNITLSEGYLNGVLFYCHIVNVYANELFPKSKFNIIAIPMALFSLNLGFEVCFYNGMTSLMRVFLQLIFPAYLFVLMGVIVLLARVSPYLTNIGFSAAKTFSTLLFVCYTCVLETSIEIFSFKYMHTLNQSFSSHWHNDANVPYFHGWHGFLFFLSILLMLIYVVPLPLVLLFPSKAYQLKYIRRLKPIYDALWAPFKPKFRSWLGFRLGLRSIPFAFAFMSVYYPFNLFILCIFSISLLSIQLIIRPFRGIVRNLFDSSLIINMIFLFTGAVFFNNRPYSGEKLDKETLDNILLTRTYFSMAFVLLAYLQFSGVFIYHLQLQIPWIRKIFLKLWLRLKQTFPFHSLLKYFNQRDATGIHLVDENLEREELDGSDSYYLDVSGNSNDHDSEFPARLYQARRPGHRVVGARYNVRKSVLSAPLLEEGSLQLTTATTAL